MATIHDRITGQSYPLEAPTGDRDQPASASAAAAEARSGAAAASTGGMEQPGHGCHDHEHSCGSNGDYDTGDHYEGACRSDSEGNFISATELWASPDRSRLQYILKLPKTDAGQRTQKFGFVGLQRVRFQCGGAKLVSYCLRCCSKPTLYDRMVEACDRFPENASWWEGPALCACGVGLVRSLNGEAGVEELMQEPPPDAAADAAAELESQMQTGGLVVEVEGGGWAVRAGPLFEGWGYVDKNGHCQTCSRTLGCRHSRSVVAPLAAKGMSAEEAQRKLLKVFNRQRGERILTCLGSPDRVLEENPVDDPVLAPIMEGENVCLQPKTYSECLWLSCISCNSSLRI